MKSRYYTRFVSLFIVWQLVSMFFIGGVSSTLAQQSQGEQLVVDFSTLVSVPDEFQNPIIQSLDSNRNMVPATNRFTVSSFRRSGDWMYVILVPTSVVDSEWTEQLAPEDMVDMLGHRSQTGAWDVQVHGSQAFLDLAIQAPSDFIDLSSELSPAVQAVNFRFPWTAGQAWYKTQGWHQNTAIDFQPVLRSDPSKHFAVLVAADGRLEQVCGGLNTNDPHTVSARITHSDGTTSRYVHLDANSFRYDLVGKTVSQGTFLGQLYNGTYGGGDGYQYRTPCGRGTAFHLHFTLPSQNVTIDGQSANSVASSYFATTFTSSNKRNDAAVPPPPTLYETFDLKFGVLTGPDIWMKFCVPGNQMMFRVVLDDGRTFDFDSDGSKGCPLTAEPKGSLIVVDQAVVGRTYRLYTLAVPSMVSTEEFVAHARIDACTLTSSSTVSCKKERDVVQPEQPPEPGTPPQSSAFNVWFQGEKQNGKTNISQRFCSPGNQMMFRSEKLGAWKSRIFMKDASDGCPPSQRPNWRIVLGAEPGSVYNIYSLAVYKPVSEAEFMKQARVDVCKVKAYGVVECNEKESVIVQPPAPPTDPVDPPADGRIPLIVIPGIMGSRLYEVGEGERWPNVFRINNDVVGLTLEPGKEKNIIATDAIRKTVYVVDVYDTFIKQLREGGYREIEIGNHNRNQTPLERCRDKNQTSSDITLFVFGYDWRRSNHESALRLAEYVDCIRDVTGSDKVDIVAHSMGGLVARRYILIRNDHHVRKLATFGTPWLGSPKAILTFFQGEILNTTQKLSTGVSDGEMKELVRYFVGVHELLPSHSYFELAKPGTPFGEDRWDINQDGRNDSEYDYWEFKRLVGDPGAGANNDDFHRSMYDYPWQDNWKNDNTGVQYYHIYGVFFSDKTIVQIRATRRNTCSSTNFGEWVCGYNKKYYFDGDLGPGDDTVPVISAARFGNGKSLLAPSTVTLYVPDNHGDMVQNKDTIEKVLEWLQDDTTIAQEQSQDPATLPSATPAYYVQVTGVPSVTITASSGHKTEMTPVDSGSETYNLVLDDVITYQMGEDSYLIIIPTDGDYTVTMPNGINPMALELRTGTGVTTTEAIRYQDVTLPTSGTLSLHVTPDGSDGLRYIQQGDKNPEGTVIQPTLEVRGDLAQDTQPPTVTIKTKLLDTHALVTITAEDSVAGVENLVYSLDGTHYQLYTGTLRLDPLQTEIVYAFADDKVANRSSEVMEILQPIAIDGPTVGDIAASYAFTATTHPLALTTPISYTWEATEQQSFVQTDVLTNSVAFTWKKEGTKLITVTATHGDTTIVDTHRITLATPIHQLYLPLVER